MQSRTSLSIRPSDKINTKANKCSAKEYPFRRSTCLSVSLEQRAVTGKSKKTYAQTFKQWSFSFDRHLAISWTLQNGRNAANPVQTIPIVPGLNRTAGGTRNHTITRIFVNQKHPREASPQSPFFYSAIFVAISGPRFVVLP